MIEPNIATIVLLFTTILLIVIIPMLDGSKRFGKYISLRYTLVCIALIMALGCILDFSHLLESSRNIILMGAFILVALFILARSLEKVKLGGKSIEIEAHKGDLGASAKIKDKDDNN